MSKTWYGLVGVRKMGIKFLLCVLTLAFAVGQGESRKITVATPALGLAEINYLIAKEKGYYQEEGLEVDLVLIAAGIANLALIGGNIEFTTGGSNAVTAAHHQGARLRVIFSPYLRPFFSLYSRADIRHVKDLKGKKIAISTLLGVEQLLAEEVLKRAGVKRQDVVFLALGVPAARYAGLQSGVVDVAELTVPHNFIAKEAGFRELVFYPNENYLVQLSGSLAVRDAFLQSEPDLVKRFVRGSLKGLLYARENRSRVVKFLTSHMKLKPDLADRIYDAYQPAMTSDGTVSQEMQRTWLEFILPKEGTGELPPAQKFIDYSLVEKINSELKANAWRPTP